MVIEADGLLALDVGHSGCEAVALVEPGLSQEELDAIVAAIQAARPKLRVLITIQQGEANE